MANPTVLTEKAKELLDELPRLGPSELAWWNIRASTLLVFAAIADMNEQSRRERMNDNEQIRY